MLIIGCGNRQRGDDGAGIVAAERLRALGIEARACLGESSELMEQWNGAADVLIIDAVVTGAPVGMVHVWDVNLCDDQKSLMPRISGASTHGMGIAEALALAHTLNRLPARLRVYGIEGKNFEVGSDLSAEVANAVTEVVRQIANEIGQTDGLPRAR